MADNTTLNAMSGGDVIATDDVSGTKYQRVKLVDGTPDSTAAIPGDATNGLDVDVTRTVPPGDSTVVAQNLALSSTANAQTLSALAGYSGVAVQITGTWTGTLVFEGSIDGGANYFLTPLVPIEKSSTTTTANTVTANGQWSGDLTGYSHFRVRCSVTGTGTAVVSIRATVGQTPVLARPLPAGGSGLGAVSLNSALLGDYDTGGGIVFQYALGLALPASGGPVAAPGDTTNGLDVDVTRVSQKFVQFSLTSAGLSTATNTYVTNNNYGTQMSQSIPAPFVSGGSMMITSIKLLSLSTVVGAMDLFLFDRSVTPSNGDRGAPGWSDADMAYLQAVIPIPAPIAFAASQSIVMPLQMPYKCNAATMYGLAVCRSTHSFFTAATDLVFTISGYAD